MQEAADGRCRTYRGPTGCPTQGGRQLLSVVVPVFNESAGLSAFHTRTTQVLDALDIDAEIIYVDDGSTDDSVPAVQMLARGDPRVCLIELSRNFGKEIAMTAGLDYAAGDAVVVIDADLQDPPELIARMVEQWRNGHDVVYATRTGRDGESRLRTISAGMFYRLIGMVSNLEIPRDTGDFRLLSRRAVNSLNSLREQHRFMKGLFAWIGFSQKAIYFQRQPRHFGRSKFSIWRLIDLAFEGLTSFTTAPLRVATLIGLIVATLSLLYGGWIVTKTVIHDDPVPGYPSLMSVVLFLGGMQMVFVGLLGEYIARIFNETKNRPLYLIRHHQRAGMPPDPADGDRPSGAIR